MFGGLGGGGGAAKKFIFVFASLKKIHSSASGVRRGVGKGVFSSKMSKVL